MKAATGSPKTSLEAETASVQGGCLPTAAVGVGVERVFFGGLQKYVLCGSSSFVVSGVQSPLWP